VLAQGGGAADKEAGRRGNAILPTRAPASFKRMLGGAINRSEATGVYEAVVQLTDPSPHLGGKRARQRSTRSIENELLESAIPWIGPGGRELGINNAPCLRRLDR
jgi:hypothetical protein